jgi:hypothetical protein
MTHGIEGKEVVITGVSGGLREVTARPTEAHQIRGEVLHVNGGAHLGKW